MCVPPPRLKTPPHLCLLPPRVPATPHTLCVFPKRTPQPTPSIFHSLLYVRAAANPHALKPPFIYALFPRVSLRLRTLFACLSNPPHASHISPPLSLRAAATLTPHHSPSLPQIKPPFLACFSNPHSLKTFYLLPFCVPPPRLKTPPYLCPLPSRAFATPHTLCVFPKPATPHATPHAPPPRAPPPISHPPNRLLNACRASKT